MQALGISFFGLVAYAINFVILLIVLRLVLYKPIKRILENRRKKIEEGLDSAELVAVEAKKQREQFQLDLDEAKKVAQEKAKELSQQNEQIREDILKNAEKDAQEIRFKAQEEIRQARERALVEIESETIEIALAISKKVIGAVIDESAQRKLVSKFLEDLKIESKR